VPSGPLEEAQPAGRQGLAEEQPAGPSGAVQPELEAVQQGALIEQRRQLQTRPQRALAEVALRWERQATADSTALDEQIATAAAAAARHPSGAAVAAAHSWTAPAG
jgi:hypothetical protein